MIKLSPTLSLHSGQWGTRSRLRTVRLHTAPQPTSRSHQHRGRAPGLVQSLLKLAYVYGLYNRNGSEFHSPLCKDVLLHCGFSYHLVKLHIFSSQVCYFLVWMLRIWALRLWRWWRGNKAVLLDWRYGSCLSKILFLLEMVVMPSPWPCHIPLIAVLR